MKDETYQGPERRKAVRRVKYDQREEVRFEPSKKDRRQNPGRRSGDLKNMLWRGFDT